MMDANKIHRIDLSCMCGLSKIDFIDNDFAIFNDISELPVKNYPRRINASIMSLCLNGSYQVGVNLKEYTITPNTLLLTLPDQIIQNVSKSEDFSGIFIAVSKDFVNEAFPRLPQLLPFMFSIKENPSIPLNKEDADCLMEYHSLLWKKVKMTHNIFRKEITKSLLLSMFYDLFNMYQQRMPQKVRPLTRKEELVDKFFREVVDNYQINRSVSYYADILCLTAKHLSSVVKQVSGKTAGEWIDDFVILEAKALLMSSDMSIQEIAEMLHFVNQSFFGKYFKQHAGMSPKEYRKR